MTSLGTRSYFTVLYLNRGRINPKAASMHAKLARRSQDSSLTHISFLFKYTRPERWWFEVADALRRVMIMGLLVFIKDDRALKACIGFALSCSSLVLFRESEPYLTTSCNALATVAQWQLIVTFFAAIILKGEPFEFETFDLMVWLLAANVCLIIGALSIQVYSGSASVEAKLKMMELEVNIRNVVPISYHEILRTNALLLCLSPRPSVPSCARPRCA